MAAIVLGYDGSAGARSALPVALGLCKAYGDRLVVVFGAAPPGRLGEEWQAHRAAIHEVANREVADAVAAAGEAGIEVETRIELAHPADALIAAGKATDARFIVVGTWGEAPLRAALVGAVPTKLLHLSDRPVLVVPAPE